MGEPPHCKKATYEPKKEFEPKKPKKVFKPKKAIQDLKKAFKTFQFNKKD